MMVRSIKVPTNMAMDLPVTPHAIYRNLLILIFSRVNENAERVLHMAKPALTLAAGYALVILLTHEGRQSNLYAVLLRLS